MIDRKYIESRQQKVSTNNKNQMRLFADLAKVATNEKDVMFDI